MCRRVECPTCHKPTFAGCGRHIDAVLGDVPVAQRCQCPRPPKRGWFAWLTQRRS